MNYLPLAESHLEALISILTESFNQPAGKARPWVEASGRENWRVVVDEEPLGGAMLIPMGQWFGGRVVGMTGLAGVVVSARARGRGVGKKLISSVLREVWDEGVALSVLNASTSSFYRANGYERAGASYSMEVSLKELNVRGGPLEIRLHSVEQLESEEKLQSEWVTEHACLSRGPYLWHRVRNPQGTPAERFGFYNGDRLEGYVFWKRSEFKGLDNELQISDMVLTTPEAQQTLLGYLAGHRAFFSRAYWDCPSSFPLLLELSEPWHYEMKLKEHWMLRIVNLPKALAERGYPVGLKGRLELEVSDPLLAENAGRWVLEVEDGRGVVKAGGEGRLQVSIDSLAPLYSGFLSAKQLYTVGRLQGPPEQISLAGELFAGEPRLSDFF